MSKAARGGHSAGDLPSRPPGRHRIVDCVANTQQPARSQPSATVIVLASDLSKHVHEGRMHLVGEVARLQAAALFHKGQA